MYIGIMLAKRSATAISSYLANVDILTALQLGPLPLDIHSLGAGTYRGGFLRFQEIPSETTVNIIKFLKNLYLNKHT